MYAYNMGKYENEVLIMYEFEHTITTTAQAATIWALYSDIATWTEWDKGIAFASLEGPFVRGTRGILQPEGQGRLSFELTEIEPCQGFSDVTDIPGAGIQVRFTHRLAPSDEGTLVTHRVAITGPNADAVGPDFIAALSEGIPHTMAGLAAMALEKERANERQ
jgi:Polyketide cyclase / dehydrase and lipid transport.